MALVYHLSKCTNLLNHYKGDYQVAKESLDVAILNIESVYADNEAARNARSLWYEEGGKDFKGEPYERSMVFYYRGLIFLAEGDYENARASFINGIMQDAFVEEEQNRSDFAVFLYLAGWSAMKMGAPELAQSHFDEMKLLRPSISIPSIEDDVLVVSETGTSPRKLGDGVGHYELVYRRGKGFKETRSDITYNGVTVTAQPIEDIYFQAATRGGRAVDRIIEGKVAFKKKTEAFGSAINDITSIDGMGGYAAAYGSSGTDKFAALTLVSVSAMALSAKAKPRADTRYWKGLPDMLHVTTLKSIPDQTQVSAVFSDQNGITYDQLSKSTDIQFDGNGSGVAFLFAR